jgi:haloalkane dehalogenase
VTSRGPARWPRGRQIRPAIGSVRPQVRPRSILAVLVLLASCASAQNPETISLRSDALRTPEDRFVDLEGFPYGPKYVAIDGYRVHYVDEGEPGAAPVLMMHGEPTWSYLYRRMIPIVVDAGHRVIAPDLIGFGRSDKPVSMEAHSYAFHVETMTRLVEELDLREITLVAQDWGSLIGLRIAAENPERFARIVLANGALPTGEADRRPGPAFVAWRNSVADMIRAGDMPVGQIVAAGQGDAVIAAYDAPFPDASYKAGPLALPMLVPVSTDDPASAANMRAWEVFRSWEKPFLTAFSDGDPITRGIDRLFQREVPGARTQMHVTIEGAGHFLQEEKGEELARVVVDFIAATR